MKSPTAPISTCVLCHFLPKCSKKQFAFEECFEECTRTPSKSCSTGSVLRFVTLGSHPIPPTHKHAVLSLTAHLRGICVFGAFNRLRFLHSLRHVYVWNKKTGAVSRAAAARRRGKAPPSYTTYAILSQVNHYR